jgi:preprotein translocase subunit SecB
MSVEQIRDEKTSKEEQDQQKQFELQRLYVKEQHCKIMRSPQVFKDEWKPEINMEMQINHNNLEGNLYEINLQINVTVKNNQITAFTAETEQAGIFLVKGFSEEEKKKIILNLCSHYVISLCP